MAAEQPKAGPSQELSTSLEQPEQAHAAIPFPPTEDAKDNSPAAVAELDFPEPQYFRPYKSAEFAVTGLGAILVIWSFCWLYVGAFWNPASRVPNLQVAILDCDTLPPAAALNASFAPLLPSLAPFPLATSLLAGGVWNASSPLAPLLHWLPVSCQQWGGAEAGGCGPREAECVKAHANSVLQGGPWALLYFPANFTAAYLSWFRGSGIQPPMQPPTSTYYYARGRDFSTYTYINSLVLYSAAPALSRSLTTGLAASPAALQLLQPAFLASGLSVAPVDLAPVRNFGQHFASYIFCVLLWLGSSFVVAASYQFKLPTEVAAADPRVGARESRQLRLRHLAAALWVKGLVAAAFMFVEVVLLCAVLWALGRGSEQWHMNPGHAIAFGWYLSWSFISINAVLLHLQGMERFSSTSALLLILQLTSASAILSSELSNRFFYIGKGLPFFYGVRGLRSIFFGSLTDHMWENWLVLTAYNVVFAPLGLWLVARRVWKSGAQAAARPGAGAMGRVVLPVAGAAV